VLVACQHLKLIINVLIRPNLVSIFLDLAFDTYLCALVLLFLRHRSNIFINFLHIEFLLDIVITLRLGSLREPREEDVDSLSINLKSFLLHLSLF
jgi:hypothetical protein